MRQTHRRVLVIGGGIAGPTLALFLRKAGIACTLYEAYPFVEDAGGGLALAPNAVKVLAALGLAVSLKSAATTISRHAFRNAAGKLLAGYPIASADCGQPMLAMSRALLFETLARAMQQEGVAAHYEKRCVGIEECRDEVVAHFADGSSESGGLLVGADGVRSSVRQYLQPETRAEYTGLIGVGGFAPRTDVPPFAADTMTFVFGRHGFFGYSGADPGTAMWWTNLFRQHEFTRQELEQLHVENVKREMAIRFGDYHPPVGALVERTHKLLRMNIYDVLSLPAWHRGRVALVGDAAHAVSPNVGQGAALALEDAMFLAKCLRDCPDHATAFARYEASRKPRAEKVVAEGRRRGRDKALVGPVQQKLREWMIRFFVGRFGAKADRWLYEYSIDWD